MIGARKLTLLQDNLASSELALSAEQLKTLEEASRIELGFAMDRSTSQVRSKLCRVPQRMPQRKFGEHQRGGNHYVDVELSSSPDMDTTCGPWGRPPHRFPDSLAGFRLS
jgi:hypothetical protein